MSRTVATEADVLNGTAKQSDSYSARLVKYVPADVITLYLTLDSAIKGGATSYNVDPLTIKVTAWTVFALMLLATPFYLMRNVGIQKPTQIVIATLSFAVWVFAVTPGGGPFSAVPYHGFYAALLLPLYTFAIAFVEPK